MGQQMRGLALSTLVLLEASCASYQYAKDVKMMSYDENPRKGTRVGEIQGADCVWSLFGYKLGGEPTVDKAFANARAQSKTSITDVVSNKTGTGGDINYLENISTERDGFNAVLVGKDCLIVKGVAYK